MEITARIELIPESFGTRNLPVNYDPVDDAKFSPTRSIIGRACFEIEFRNIFVNRELLLFDYFSISKYSFVWDWQHYDFKKPLPYLKFLIKNLLLKKTTEEPTHGIWVWDNYSTGGYYHWITEILPRLYLCKEKWASSILPVPDYFYERWAFIRESLQMLSTEGLRWRLINAKEKVFFNSMTLITQTGGPLNYHKQPLLNSALGLKNLFILPESRNVNKKIYISRAKAKHRRIVNEEDLLPILNQYGIQRYFFEDLTMQEQISLCASASHMIGMHGAGLSNMVYMPTGGKVFEIRQNIVLPIINCFYTLADTLQIDYYYINGTPVKEQHETNLRVDDASLIIDSNKFNEQLAIFCK